MPSCSVPGCKNVYGKGFKLYKFPRNEYRRKLWVKMINRPNWKPTDNSVICEVHFADDDWEKVRVDGTKKLKSKALPTLFFNACSTKQKIIKPTQSIIETSNSKNQKVVLINTPNKNEVMIQLSSSRKSPRKKLFIKTVEDTEGIQLFVPESEEIPLFDPQSEEILFDADSKEIPLLNTQFYTVASNDIGEENINSDTVLGEIQEQNGEIETFEEKFSPPELMDQETEDIETTEKLKQCMKVSESTEKARIILQKQVTSFKTRLKRLEEIRDESKVLIRLKTIFNEDQLLSVVKGGNSKVIWSYETLEKALKLRLTCGEPGYKELLRQNMPLPSLKSLRRAVKLSNFTKRFSEEVLEYLQTELI